MRRFSKFFALTAVSLALLMGGSQLALADSWGPKTSTYNGNVVVEGYGTITRYAQYSRSGVTAKDRRSDGNTVYGQSRWQRLDERCTSFGISKIIEGTVTSCDEQLTTVKTYTTRETTSLVYGSFNQYWCDQNGDNCANNGLKVRAYACAQMGWPVPDSCTYAVVEYHRP